MEAIEPCVLRVLRRRHALETRRMRREGERILLPPMGELKESFGTYRWSLEKLDAASAVPSQARFGGSLDHRPPTT